MRNNPFGLDGVFSDDSELDVMDQIMKKVEANIPVFLHGLPGVGKSQRVKQIDPDCEILELSITPPEEMKGVPYIDEEEEVQKSKPEWLVRLEKKCEAEPDKIHVLFLDELTNAEEEIKKLAYSLILDRVVADTWKIPDNVRIIAAGNASKDSIVAEDMSKPLKNRMAHIPVKADVEKWLEWARSNGIHPLIIEFISQNPSWLLCQSKKENGFYISPRSWERVSQVLNAGGDLHYANSILGTIPPELIMVYEKYTGKLFDAIRRTSHSEQIQTFIDLDIPLFLHGKPGEGKSQRVLEIDPDSTVIELSLLPLEELTGLIVNDGGKTIKKMPEWLKELIEKCKKEPDKNHILFLDELTNAYPAIQKLAYSIILDRTVGNKWKLPDNVRIVAAGNEVEDSIVAEEMPIPLKNRFAHVKINTELSEWIEWAVKKKIEPSIIAFVSSHSGAFFKKDKDQDDGERAITPRTWERASKILSAKKRVELVRDVVGPKMFESFKSFYGFKKPSLEDLKNGIIDTNLNAFSLIPLFLKMRPSQYVNCLKMISMMAEGSKAVILFTKLWHSLGKDMPLAEQSEAIIEETTVANKTTFYEIITSKGTLRRTTTPRKIIPVHSQEESDITYGDLFEEPDASHEHEHYDLSEGDSDSSEVESDVIEDDISGKTEVVSEEEPEYFEDLPEASEPKSVSETTSRRKRFVLKT